MIAETFPHGGPIRAPARRFDVMLDTETFALFNDPFIGYGTGIART